MNWRSECTKTYRCEKVEVRHPNNGFSIHIQLYHPNGNFFTIARHKQLRTISLFFPVQQKDKQKRTKKRTKKTDKRTKNERDILTRQTIPKTFSPGIVSLKKMSVRPFFLSVLSVFCPKVRLFYLTKQCIDPNIYMLKVEVKGCRFLPWLQVCCDLSVFYLCCYQSIVFCVVANVLPDILVNSTLSYDIFHILDRSMLRH